MQWCVHLAGVFKQAPNLSRIVLVLLGCQLSACSSVPDIGYARYALSVGQEKVAVQHLTYLSDFGVSRAQIFLGDYYLSSGRPAWPLAEQFYLKAYAAGAPFAPQRLGRLYYRNLAAGPAEYSVLAAQYMEEALARNDDRVLADLWSLYLGYPALSEGKDLKGLIDDGIANGNKHAFYALFRYRKMMGGDAVSKPQLIDLCIQALPVADDCYLELTELAHAHPAAISMSRVLEIMEQHWSQNKLRSNLVWKIAMHINDLGHSEDALAALEMIQSDYPRAFYGQAKITLNNPKLDDVNQLMSLLESGRNNGVPSAFLLSARLNMEGTLIARNPTLALKYLGVAARDLPRANYYLGVYYRDGLAGRFAGQRSVNSFLEAARGGYGRADLALAKYFWLRDGVERNTAFALSFAQFAKKAKVAGSQLLLKEIEQAASLAEQRQAAVLYEQETTARLDRLLRAENPHSAFVQ